MPGALPSPALPTVSHHLCPGLGEGNLKNSSRQSQELVSFSLGVIPHSVPAQATLIHRCDDLRVASCCPAPTPPPSNVGFWIPLVTLDFTPASTHRDPKDASELQGEKLSLGGAIFFHGEAQSKGPPHQATFHSPWNSMRRGSWLPSSHGTGITLQSHCPPGDGCASWQPLPEAFPAPRKVSRRLLLLHHWQTHPWSSLPAAPGDGVRVLEVPFSILVLQWSSSALALGCSGKSRVLLSPALWGGTCLKAAVTSWHLLSLASELMPTHPGMGWIGQPETWLVPLSKACPRSSSPRCLHSALLWYLVPLWHKGSAVFSSPAAPAARGSRELHDSDLWDLLGFLINSSYLGSISLVCPSPHDVFTLFPVKEWQ